MDANATARTILKELSFDFAAFTMTDFLQHVSQIKGREIFTIPWEMPSTLFGAWISDDDEPSEYIFYRNNISETHQIHVQLHELSHFLFGHPTLRINRERIVEAVNGIAPLPFDEMPQFRSSNLEDLEEVEAEALANLIQHQAIRNFKLDSLVHNPAPEEKLAYFMQKLGASL